MLWHKEKMLMMSNFSFCQNIFRLFNDYNHSFMEIFHTFWLHLFKFVCCRFSVCWKGLTFLLLPQCFQPFSEIIPTFIELFHVFQAQILSKLSAADFLYVGKGFNGYTKGNCCNRELSLRRDKVACF